MGSRFVGCYAKGKEDYILSSFEDFFFSGWGVKEPSLRPLTPEEPSQHAGRLPDLLPKDFYENASEGDGPAALELESWLGRHPETTNDPVAFWQRQQQAFPTLSQKALDILSIPPMSAECERIFSQAKLTMGPQRQQLVDESVEAIECLKYWRGNT